MSPRKELQPFRFAGAVERRKRKVGGAYHIRVPNHHQQRRRPDSFYEGAGFVLRIELEGTKGYLVAPFRKAPLVFRRRELSSEERPRIRARMRGQSTSRGLNHHGHHFWCSTTKSVKPIRVEHAALIDHGRRRGTTHGRFPTADGRNLGYHALDAPIYGSDHEHMAACVAASPHTDPISIDPVETLRKGDRMAVIPYLHPGIQFLTRYAIAIAEVPMVIRNDDMAGRGDRRRILVQVELLQAVVAMCHDHHWCRYRCRFRTVEPSTQHDTLGAELNVRDAVGISLFNHQWFAFLRGRNRTFGLPPRRRNASMLVRVVHQQAYDEQPEHTLEHGLRIYG